MTSPAIPVTFVLPESLLNTPLPSRLMSGFLRHLSNSLMTSCRVKVCSFSLNDMGRIRAFIDGVPEEAFGLGVVSPETKRLYVGLIETVIERCFNPTLERVGRPTIDLGRDGTDVPTIGGTSREARDASSAMAVVDVMNLPDDIPMKTNPREQKLTTAVAKKIRRSLLAEDGANNFYLLNRGLLLSAAQVAFNNYNNELTILFEDDELHGDVDGGHTYKIIKECRDQLAPGQQYVKLEILTGIEGMSKGEVKARARRTAAEALRTSGTTGAWRGTSPISDYIRQECEPAVVSSSLRESSKRRYLLDLNLLADALSGYSIAGGCRPKTIKDALNRIAAGHGTATARQVRKVAGKWVVQRLVLEEVINYNPLRDATIGIDVEYKASTKAAGGVALTEDEYVRVLDYLLACDPADPERTRPRRGHWTQADREAKRRGVIGICLLQATTGLRINEARMWLGVRSLAKLIV